MHSLLNFNKFAFCIELLHLSLFDIFFVFPLRNQFLVFQMFWIVMVVDHFSFFRWWVSRLRVSRWKKNNLTHNHFLLLIMFSRLIHTSLSHACTYFVNVTHTFQVYSSINRCMKKGFWYIPLFVNWGNQMNFDWIPYWNYQDIIWYFSARLVSSTLFIWCIYEWVDILGIIA